MLFARKREISETPTNPLKMTEKRGFKMIQTYEIKKGVARPANLPNRQTGEVKYKFREMEVDDYFEVPKEDFIPGQPFDPEKYDAKKFRERINQSARNAALKFNKEAEAKDGFNPETYVPVRFTVAVLENQNIGVWRDS